MESTELLKEIHKIIIDYRAEKGLGDNEFAEDADLAPTALIAIEGEKYTPKGKLKTVDLLTVLKIFNKYPELQSRILAHLSTNTDKNHTDVDKASNNNKKASASKTEALGLLDKHPDYYLMPKIMLEKHRLISLEQMEDNRKLFEYLVERNEELSVENAELRAKLPATKKAKQNSGV